MESLIAKALETRYPPLAILWTDEIPPGTMQFQQGKWGCIMWLAAAAARGRPAACDKDSLGCVGGGVGMGFGELYKQFPGGEEGFCRFLSSGIEGWPEGQAVAAGVRPFLREETYDDFVHGERYLKSPAEVRRFLAALPFFEVPKRYVLFLPLPAVDDKALRPEVVVFFADPDELAALVVLANYGRGDNENVLTPFAAGCQTLGIYPYREARSGRPRAVVGLTDLSARLFIRRQLGGDLLSFAVPFSLFAEMEGNVKGSFLERPTWQALLKEKRARRSGGS